MHTKQKPLPEGTGLLHQAQAAEKDGETPKAIKLYEELLKENNKSEQIYQRLMILHRKNKDYKKELKTIDAAIKAFSHLYKGKQKANPLIAKLSKKLSMLTGLTDKKGQATHDPEPLATWKKRREVVARKV